MEEPKNYEQAPDLTGVDMKQFSSNYFEYLAIGNLPEDQQKAAIHKLMEKVREQNPNPPQTMK